MMKVSIIVPVFNSEKTLSRCLQSLSIQTFKDFEVICVNDGSSDSSWKILQQWAGQDPRFKIFDKPNSGVATTRNYALDISQGQFIGFLDSDDTYENAFLEKMVQTLESDNVDIIACGVNLIHVQGRKFTDYDQKYFNPSIASQTRVSQSIFYSLNAFLWNKLFRREIITSNNLRFPDGLWYEDSAFVWTYLLHAGTASIVPEKLCNYYRTESSIMGQTHGHSKKSFDHLRILPHVGKYLFEKKLGEKYLKDYLEFTLVNLRESLKFMPYQMKLSGLTFYLKTLNSPPLQGNKLKALIKVYSCLFNLILSKILGKLRLGRS